MGYYSILVYVLHRNIIFFYKNNNRFKTSAPTWNKKLEQTDGSYSLSHNTSIRYSISNMSLNNMKK